MNQQMDNIQCSVNIDNENKLIALQGLLINPLTIDFNGDVDFNELVSVLTSLIDTSKKIELESLDTFPDEKLKLIIETISSIIEKYNESISNSESQRQEIISKFDDLS